MTRPVVHRTADAVGGSAALSTYGGCRAWLAGDGDRPAHGPSTTAAS